MNFNSIKVRLEPIVLLIIADYRLFQFHKGTIRTPDRLISAISSHIFQFHKGTIRTNIDIIIHSILKRISIP